MVQSEIDSQAHDRISLEGDWLWYLACYFCLTINGTQDCFAVLLTMGFEDKLI